MATLLGKCNCGTHTNDAFAKVAFNLALDYLPDSNFLYSDCCFLCDANNVRFNDAGIDGSCVGGTNVRVYTYKVPSVSAELYMYKSNLFWYITTKCRFDDGSCGYVEFVFEEESVRGNGFNRSNIYAF